MFDGDLAGDFVFLKQALDDPGLSESYKFQELVDQIKFPRALMTARSNVHEATPCKTFKTSQSYMGSPRTSALRYSLSAPLLGCIYLCVSN